MKNLISLAIASLIQAAVAPEGRQFGNVTNVETLANRLARIIPESRLEMLVNGVPSALNIVDEQACLAAITRRVGSKGTDPKIIGTEITYDFDGRIRFSYKKTRYAKTPEQASEYECNEECYGGRAEQDDEYQYPFTATLRDSIDFHLDEDNFAKYGVEVVCE